MAKDRFGIDHIFATKNNGEVWQMSDNPKSDGRIKIGGHGGTISGSKSDGFKLSQNQQVRLGVQTSSGYKASKIELDHSKCEEQGFMQDSRDWRNVEMTLEFNLDHGSDDSVTCYCRGGTHNDNNGGCEGSALKIEYDLGNGQARPRKEQWHVSYVSQSWKDVFGGGNSDGVWRRWKCVFYNEKSGGTTNTVQEMYFDKNMDNTWERVFKYVDNGGWGSEGTKCGGKKDQRITWGGPLANFRWDDCGNNCKFRNMSVREINTDQNQGPDDSTGGDAGDLPPPDTDPDPGGNLDQGNNDQLGVRKIYQTKTDGETWFMDANNFPDNRVDPQGGKISKNSDGSFRYGDLSTRMLVFTSEAGKLSDSKRADIASSKTFAELESQGVWYKGKDFRNFEITAYVHVNSYNSVQGMEGYGQSVKHDTAVANGCGGSAYKCTLEVEGKARIRKEMWHSTRALVKDYVDSGVGKAKGKWIGFKVIQFNYTKNGRLCRKIEGWNDKANNNTWVKHINGKDEGSIGNTGDSSTDGRRCGGSADQIITWGSPNIDFRWDDISSIDIQKLSVREIVPPSNPDTPDVPQNLPSGGGSGGSTTVPAGLITTEYTIRYTLGTDSSDACSLL